MEVVQIPKTETREVKMTEVALKASNLSKKRE